MEERLIAATRLAHRYMLASLLLASLCSCGGDDGVSADHEVNLVAGVDLEAVFAPPRQAEVDGILAEWATYNVSADGFRVEAINTDDDREDAVHVAIVSHLVDGNRHFGAVIAPVNSGPLPVIVYLHPGDTGTSVEAALLVLSTVTGVTSSDFILVVPSFRSQPLQHGPDIYQSEGATSPWDGDVDDSLSLLAAVVEAYPQADPDRIAVVGLSAGATVGMLMAIREPRIAKALNFFGPVDFMAPFVQNLMEQALLGQPADLPGLDYLENTLLPRHQSGELSVADLRLELIRRSPLLFVDRLPRIQIHHGTSDQIVPVSQSKRLGAALSDQGNAVELFLYKGAGHNPLEFSGSFSRAQSFLNRLHDSAKASPVDHLPNQFDR